MANRETIALGEVRFGNEILISDPCYDVDTWCTARVGVKRGVYVAEIDVVDLGEWGKRVSAIRISHKDFRDVDADIPVQSTIGVDSGQCGFWKTNAFAKIKADKDKNEAFYDRVCSITLSNNGGVDKIGVVSNTGFGDGGYSAYVGKNDDGEVVAVEVVFITDAEIEDWESSEDA